MKKVITTLTVTTIVILAMTGCTKTQEGAGIGAAVGALAGGTLIDAGVGAVAGGVIGNSQE
jgi:hypothetical protein